MNNTSSEENHNQESSTSEEKTLSEIYYHFDELPKIIINKNLSLYFTKDCSYVSLTPIIPTNQINYLFKLYKIPESKEEIITKIKNYINTQEAKIDKIYTINDIKVHKSKGNITIIDELFNKNCLVLSKQSNDAMQIIADKIALGIYNTKKIIYKYEKNEEEKMIYVIANLKIEEDINIKSDLYINEKSARDNVNKKIIMKYLPKRLAKEIMINIENNKNKENKMKIEKKERYEMHLLEAGLDHKLLNKKRNLDIEEFTKRLPYFNMLDKDKEKNKTRKIRLKKNKMNLNDISLEEDNIDSFINTEEMPLNDILLGDPNIVDNHLRDFKYTPLKLFEMIRDSEKFRGVDLRIEYSLLNNKNYSVNILSVIISQKLGIKVEGYGNSKEEAGNKCSLNFLAVLFKNVFRTYHQLHDYFEHKNKRYLDIILKDENDKDNKKIRKNKSQNNISNNINNKKITKKNDNMINNNNIKSNKNKNENLDENIQRSIFDNWKNYSNKKRKIIEDDDSDYWCPKKKNTSGKIKTINIDYCEDDFPKQNNNNSQKSSNESQESCVKYDFEQSLYSEFINNTSCSDINIITNLNNYNSHSSSNTGDIGSLKNSGLGLSISNYSITNGSKKKTK